MEGENDATDTHKRILNVERAPAGHTEKVTPMKGSCLSNSHIHERPEAWRVNADNWLTTNRAVHDDKIQDPLLYQPIVRMAPSLTKMEFTLSEKASLTSQLHRLNKPREKITSTMRSDYLNWNDQPIKQILDVMQGIPSGYVPPKLSSVGDGFKGCILKPYFTHEDLFSITRKSNPYISTTHIDFRNIQKSKW